MLGGYDYTISYKPGQQHANADMLSRLPSTEAPANPPVPPEIVHILETLDSSPVTSIHIRQWTTKDPTLAKIRDSIITGERPQDDIAKPYYKWWDELTVEQGCLLRGNRVVIPPKERKAVMEVLHEGHQGETQMKALARSFVWWPGIDGDLESTVQECDRCQRTRHSPPQALLHPWGIPSYPLGMFTCRFCWSFPQSNVPHCGGCVFQMARSGTHVNSHIASYN